MRWLDGIIESMDMTLNQLQEIVKDKGASHAVACSMTMGSQRVGHNLATEQRQQPPVPHNATLFRDSFIADGLHLWLS